MKNRSEINGNRRNGAFLVPPEQFDVLIRSKSIFWLNQLSTKKETLDGFYQSFNIDKMKKTKLKLELCILFNLQPFLMWTTSSLMSSFRLYSSLLLEDSTGDYFAFCLFVRSVGTKKLLKNKTFLIKNIIKNILFFSTP